MSVFIQSGFFPETPLTHARIGWQNIVRSNNVTGTNGLTGNPLISLTNSLTYDRYRPNASPATITVDAGTNVTCDYFGIAAHTLNGATIVFASSTNNSTYTTRLTITPTNNDPIMGLFAPVTARYWRLTITFGVAPFIGSLYVGKVLEMQRPIYQGINPPKLSRVTEIKPNISETGQWLGRSIVRKGYQTSLGWNNLKADWYRQNFEPFTLSARENPFFIAWRPETFDNDIMYSWTNGDIVPTNSGPKDFMSVSINIEGYDGI
jgi:hypothetical protein